MLSETQFLKRCKQTSNFLKPVNFELVNILIKVDSFKMSSTEQSVLLTDEFFKVYKGNFYIE